jgi:sugar lactone lactonase YvrE
LYSVDLPTRRVTELARGLGEPAALAVDSVRRTVFVADAARHKIWVVSSDTPGQAPRDLAPTVKLREPLGLAFDASRRTLWIGDHAESAFYSLSTDGHVTATVR